MKLIRKLAVLIVALAGASVAQADPIIYEGLCNGTADSSITCDSNTGLEWLDLTTTLGLSYNEALNSDYVTDLGFRHATESELLSLYVSARIPVVGQLQPDGTVTNGTSALNRAGVEFLLPLLGCTFICSTGEAAAQGFLDISDPNLTAYAFIQLKFPSSASATGIWSPQPRDLLAVSFLRDQTGNFLVRSVSVPEPSTLALFALGLFGMIFMQRKALPTVSSRFHMCAFNVQAALN